ncbi:ABC transporter ATP-binding protein [Curvibacter gracilis]|uniref:ABC transporter ATP-binding protein n=1 Tax=Curvibacter gracilis TaxID=230310 RepID=UPI0004B18922|nr:ATP-binding cassette domain-containing protein [Curvibacter gracilis]
MALLEVESLVKTYPLPAAPGQRAGRDRAVLRAVDGVSLRIEAGQALGLVGESGSGKSTTAALVARLADPDSGQIRLDGEDLARVPARRAARAPWRAQVQLVFQDAAGSLNPRHTAQEAIAQPLQHLAGLSGQALQRRVLEAAALAQLPEALLQRLPHQLSGGQAARVGLARAIGVRPRLLILDEPTSALDVSVQMGLLQRLDALRRELGLSLLFVSHDLEVVRLLCQQVAVMRRGRIVESGVTEQVMEAPRHPYTAQLMAALGELDGAD